MALNLVLASHRDPDRACTPGRCLEFSVFPTLLLVLTVFGLALNVSSTRLILSQGAAFDGQLVRAFANFVDRFRRGRRVS